MDSLETNSTNKRNNIDKMKSLWELIGHYKVTALMFKLPVVGILFFLFASGIEASIQGIAIQGYFFIAIFLIVMDMVALLSLHFHISVWRFHNDENDKRMH